MWGLMWGFKGIRCALKATLLRCFARLRTRWSCSLEGLGKSHSVGGLFLACSGFDPECSPFLWMCHFWRFCFKLLLHYQSGILQLLRTTRILIFKHTCTSLSIFNSLLNLRLYILEVPCRCEPQLCKGNTHREPYLPESQRGIDFVHPCELNV